MTLPPNFSKVAKLAKSTKKFYIMYITAGTLAESVMHNIDRKLFCPTLTLSFTPNFGRNILCPKTGKKCTSCVYITAGTLAESCMHNIDKKLSADH